MLYLVPSLKTCPTSMPFWKTSGLALVRVAGCGHADIGDLTLASQWEIPAGNDVHDVVVGLVAPVTPTAMAATAWSIDRILVDPVPGQPHGPAKPTCAPVTR